MFIYACRAIVSAERKRERERASELYFSFIDVRYIVMMFDLVKAAYDSSTHAANSRCLTRVHVTDKRIWSSLLAVRLKLHRMIDIYTSLRGFSIR